MVSPKTHSKLPFPRNMTVGERARYWREKNKSSEHRIKLLLRQIKHLKAKIDFLEKGKSNNINYGFFNSKKKRLGYKKRRGVVE